MCLALNEGHAIPEVLRENRTEDLDKQVNSFEICEFVIIGINTDAEEKAGISPIDNFVVPELVCGSASMPGRD